MKSNFVKIIGGTILTFAVISIAAFGVIFAQAEPDFQNGGGRIDGTWNVRVAITNCQTGAEIRYFASLTTFMTGGTLLDSTSGTPQALRGPGHGVWRHEQGNTYKFSFKAFSFDAANNFTGWTIVRHEATLDAKGDAYESAGTAEFYAANGNLVGTGCSATTAVRLE